MRTKPLAPGACALLLAGVCLSAGFPAPVRAAPLPTLVLYPRARSSAEDVRALVDLRRKLRADGRFDVLTYDPASAAMIRAAGDARRPELLTGPMTADADRLALTRALGAAFLAVVSKAEGRGKSDTRLVEAAPSARAWSILDKKTDDAARAIEDQTADALQHPVPVAARPVPASVPARPPVVAAAPVPVAAAPVPVIPAPAPLLAEPVLSLPAPAVTAPVASPVPAAAPPPQAAPLPTAAPAVPALPQPAPVTLAPSTPEVPADVPPVAAAPPAVMPAAPAPPAVMPAAPAPTTPTRVAPSSAPLPAPATVVAAPGPTPSAPPPDDLSGIKSRLQAGDAQLAQGNFVGAIASYRDAVNGAPLSAVPRIKLAQTYLEADMRDKALDEARRALQIAPGDASIQQFLTLLDAQSGTSDGAVARFTAQVAQSPQEPMSHVELADALWNNNTLEQAESEYKAAQSLAGPGTPAFQTAAAHLARLYAAQKRYDDSLSALRQAGPGGYALALGIVQNRADTLSSTLDGAQDAFTAGKSTHADFYKMAGDVSAQARLLADFVIKVSPPAAFKLSHLYRVQATHLLAQQAAVLVGYIETSDPAQADKAAQLGRSAQTEMLMAHAAEQKLGLWGGRQTEARN